MSAAVSTFSRLDVLISNAGICPFHTFLDLPTSLWKRVQDVNLNGAFYVVQAAANQMAKQDPNPVTNQRGSIVAISSISALMGGGEQCHYTPTKAGIKSLMESTAIALGPLGIRCNSVLPGKFLIHAARCGSHHIYLEHPRPVIHTILSDLDISPLYISLHTFIPPVTHRAMNNAVTRPSSRSNYIPRRLCARL